MRMSRRPRDRPIRPEVHADAVLDYLRGTYGGEWKAVGTRTIAAALGISRKAVVKTLDWLEQEGRIEKMPSRGARGSTGINFYRIMESHDARNTG